MASATRPFAAPSAATDRIMIDERLISGNGGILATGGRFGAIGPADRDTAKSQAEEARQLLAAQSASIANRKPNVVAGLFR
jgi:hypothetical protein